MQAIDDLQQSPGHDEADALRLPERRDPQRLGPVGQLLVNFLEVMNAAGDGAEEAYAAALGALRERSFEAVLEIARLENACETWDYPTRWGLVHAAASLEQPAALPFFRSLVLTPIPPERGVDPHSFSTVAEETILRTTAVDGVAVLARAGSREAVETLLDFLSVPSFSVKRAAVQGLLAADEGESLRDRIEKRLCPEDRMLLDIRPLDVRKVTQIDDPESHLDETGRLDAVAATPDLPDRQKRTKAKRAADEAPRGHDGSDDEREG